MIPMNEIMMPPSNHIDAMTDVHPSGGLRKKAQLITRLMIYTKETKEINRPK